MYIFISFIQFFVQSIHIYLVSTMCQTLGIGDRSMNKTIKNKNTIGIYNTLDANERYGVK